MSVLNANLLCKNCSTFSFGSFLEIDADYTITDPYSDLALKRESLHFCFLDYIM